MKELTERFPPQALRDHALLADGERGALLGPRGDIVWMCAPRWDRGSVFASLIGAAGVYAVTPIGRFVWGGFYERGSLIWRSRWVTNYGIVECREALALPSEPDRLVLLRRIVAVEDDARVRVDARQPAPGLRSCRHVGVGGHSGLTRQPLPR
jgi:alpha,alpha-trehalase